MDITTMVAVGGALGIGITLGIVCHEATHAAVLRAAGVDYEFRFHSSSRGLPSSIGRVPLASVRPRPTPSTPPLSLRLAALAPLTLALPVLVLGATGAVPTIDRPIAWALVVSCLACALPSPQDFSVAFYAHRLATDDGWIDPIDSPDDAS